MRTTASWLAVLGKEGSETREVVVFEKDTSQDKSVNVIKEGTKEGRKEGRKERGKERKKERKKASKHGRGWGT